MGSIEILRNGLPERAEIQKAPVAAILLPGLIDGRYWLEQLLRARHMQACALAWAGVHPVYALHWAVVMHAFAP